MPKTIANLMQCVVLGGIVGAFLCPAVLITIGLVVIGGYQVSGHVVDNGFAPFAEFEGPWFLVAGPGAGVLAAMVMCQVSGARSARSIALLTGLPVATIVAALATLDSGGLVLWEEIWIKGSWFASTLVTTAVSAWLAKHAGT